MQGKSPEEVFTTFREHINDVLHHTITDAPPAMAPFSRTMRESLIFETETERAEMRTILSEAFPLGKLWYVPDDVDFIMEAEFPCSEQAFFRYALQAPGPSGRLIFSCLRLILMTLDPPAWMVSELSKPQRQLPANT